MTDPTSLAAAMLVASRKPLAERALGDWLRAGLLTLVALTLAVSLLSLWANFQRWEMSERVQEAQRDRLRVAALTDALDRYVADVRGYVLFGDAASRTRLEAARAVALEAQRALALAHEADPHHGTTIARLGEETKELLAFHDGVIASVRGADNGPAIARLRQGEGRARIAEIRALLDVIRLEEERVIAEDAAQSAAREVNVWAATLAAVLAQIALVALGFAVLRRELAKRAEARRALAASDSRLRALLSMAADWIWEQDAEHRFTFFSDRGMTHGIVAPAAVLGRRRWEVEGMEPLAGTWEEHRALLERHEPFRDFATRTRQADGSFRYLLVSGEPRLDENGRFVGYRGTAHEITAQFRLEEALQRSREEMRDILDNVPALISRFGRDQRLAFANRAVCDTFGLSWKEILGKPVREIVGEDGWTLVAPMAERVLAGESSEYVRSVPRADGSVRHLHFRFVPQRDASGEVVGWYSLGRDVTEERRAREALEASEASFRKLVDASPEAIFVSRQGSFVFANAAAARLFGAKDAADLVGRAVFDLIHPDSRAAVERRVRALMEGAKSLPPKELTYLRLDGSSVDVEAASARFRHQGERAVLSVARDIGERKREARIVALEHAVTRALAQAEGVSAGVQGALRAVCESLGCEAGVYFRADERGAVLRFAESWNAPGPALERLAADFRQTTFARGAGIAGRVWASGEPIWVPEVAGDERVVNRDLASEMRIRSLFVFPVVAGGRIAGTVSTFSRQLRRPDERLLAAMRVIGSQLGQFLQRKEAEERAALHARRQERVARFGEFALAETDPQRLLAEAVRAARGDEAEVAMLLELNDGEFTVRAASGEPGERFVGRSHPVAPDSVWPRLLDSNTPILIDAEYLRSRPVQTPWRAWIHQMGSAIYVPVRANGTRAMLAVYSTREQAFGDEDMHHVAAIGSILSTALQRRHAEAGVVTTRERMRIALEASRASVWETDLRSGSVYLSESWAAMLGGKPIETRTTREALMAMTHPGDLPRFAAAWVAVMKGEAAEFSEDHRVRGGGGEWRWVRTAGRVIERDASGRALRMSGTNLDVTRAKHEESLLALEHAVTRALATAEDSAAGIATTLRAVGESQDWDAAVYYEADDVAGLLRYAQAWQVSDPDLSRVIEGYSRTSFARGVGLPGRVWESAEPLWSADAAADPRVAVAELVAQAGTRSMFVFPVTAEGRILGTIGALVRRPREPDARLLAAVRVIGSQLGQFLQRMQAEAALRESEREVRALNAGLEQRVAERTAALQSALHDLNTFTSAVSHDLRAPARRMAGFAGLLRVELGESLSGEARRIFGVIEAQAKEMNELIERLLELGRASHRALHPVALDAAALAREAWDSLDPALAGRAELRLDGLPPLRADRVLLKQVFVNLLGNALKFSAGRAQPRVEVSACTADGRVEFCVRDNGAGFDMAQAERLFRPFSRLHTREEFEGTGVGLSIVETIVRRHGGTVRAEGRPGEGAVICFSLPS